MAISLKNLSGGGVKSIQRGVTAVVANNSTNVTISPVLLEKSVVIFGHTCSSGANGVVAYGVAALSSSTSLSVSTTCTSAGTSVSVHWQVVEYY